MSNELKARRCPGCGATVLLDESTWTVRHPNPICEPFKTMAAEAGLRPRRAPWVAFAVPDSPTERPN